MRNTSESQCCPARPEMPRAHQAVFVSTAPFTPPRRLAHSSIHAQGTGSRRVLQALRLARMHACMRCRAERKNGRQRRACAWGQKVARHEVAGKRKKVEVQCSNLLQGNMGRGAKQATRAYAHAHTPRPAAAPPPSARVAPTRRPFTQHVPNASRPAAETHTHARAARRGCARVASPHKGAANQHKKTAKMRDRGSTQDEVSRPAVQHALHCASTGQAPQAQK